MTEVQKFRADRDEMIRRLDAMGLSRPVIITVITAAAVPANLALDIVLVFGFLYLPIAALIVYSFNASQAVGVWSGFSTRWYGALLDDEALDRRATALG